MSIHDVLPVQQATPSPDSPGATHISSAETQPSLGPSQLQLRTPPSLQLLPADRVRDVLEGTTTTAIMARELHLAVQDYSHHNHGTINNTANTYDAPVTTIQKANTVNVAPNDDLVLLETLPKHPDVSNQWTENLRNSRDEAMKEIFSWTDDPTERCLVLWIHAAAGTGKSALAYQLKLSLRSRNRLAAPVFLANLPSPGTWGPESIIRLIGAEIGRTHRAAIPTIAEAVRQCHGASLPAHVKSFVLDPLLNLRLPHPLIILLDAVDGWASHIQFFKQLVHLTQHASVVRFIILARCEPSERIRNLLPIKTYALSPVPVEVMRDRICELFGTIQWGQTRRPSPQDIRRLAEVVGGAFTRAEEVVGAIVTLQRHLLGCADLSAMMNTLGFPIHSPYEQGSLEALDRSILFYKAAVALRPLGNPDRPSSLHNLATTLYSRYHGSGNLQDLEEAIVWHREGLDLRPSGHPDRAPCLHNLALALKARYENTGDTRDLEEAIALHREAMAECAIGHHNRATFLYQFTLALYLRFEKEGADGDLDEAISVGREALGLRPGTHPQRYHSLWNIQRQLHRRFRVRGTVGDLREAISMAQEALSLCPQDSPDHSMFLRNLSTYHGELVASATAAR